MDTVLQQQTRCSTVKTLTRTTTFSSRSADLLPLGMTFKVGYTPGGADGNANAFITQRKW